MESGRRARRPEYVWVMLLAPFMALSLGLGASASAVSTPPPTAAAGQPPLKEIGHVVSSPMCNALRRNIGPAIGHVLQSDKFIAQAQPIFVAYARDHAAGRGENTGAEDLDVLKLENLITPFAANTNAAKKLLGEPGAFPRKIHSDQDKQTLIMREQLKAVLAQQEDALNLISGFVATQQMGELQAAGNQYQKAIGSPDTANSPAPASPTSAPDNLLNAGLPDKTRQSDPRFQNTDSLVGNNPLSQFARAVTTMQRTIDARENAAAQSVLKVVPVCAGTPRIQSTPPPKTP